MIKYTFRILHIRSWVMCIRSLMVSVAYSTKLSSLPVLSYFPISTSKMIVICELYAAQGWSYCQQGASFTYVPNTKFYVLTFGSPSQTLQYIPYIYSIIWPAVHYTRKLSLKTDLKEITFICSFHVPTTLWTIAAQGWSSCQEGASFSYVPSTEFFDFCHLLK